MVEPAMQHERHVVVWEGVALIPPKAGDCACVFCGRFRAQHLWWRAGAATLAFGATMALAFWALGQQFLEYRAGIVGGTFLIATGLGWIMLISWWQPARRLLHRLRPRLPAPGR